MTNYYSIEYEPFGINLINTILPKISHNKGKKDINYLGLYYAEKIRKII